jgi:hypothetical protein
MTVKKAAISIGDWLKSTGFSAEKTLASAQEQRKNLLQQMDNANASYLTGENRGALQNAFSNYQATMNVLRGAGYDTGNDVDVLRRAVHSSFDFQNQFKDENDFNVSYAYPKKYKGKTRTDVDAALAQLKNTPGAEAEYDWLNKNQMNYWSADELKAQIGAWKNEISGIERQRRNMPRMAAGSTDADYAKRQQEALALSGQIDERKAKIGKAQSLLTRKTYDDEISKWDTQMQRALSDYSKALSVSESANTETAMAGNSAFVVQNSDYAKNARNTVRSFEQQLRDYGYSDQQINGIRNYALTQQHANEAAEMAQQVAQEAKEHPWLSSAMSVGTNMMAGAGALDIAAQNALNGTDPFTGEKMAVDRYTKSMVPSTVTNTIRGSVSEDMSGIGSFLYNTGMSMADSLATLAVGGATGLHGAADVILGGAAASQAITDAYDRGASDSQAMSVGLLYGTAEALFEHISLGKLRTFHTSAAAGKKTAKTLVKDMLKQSFVEGSEEVCTDIANVISDAIVMADKSEINQTIAAYQADGMSEDEATRRAWLDWLGQTAQDFAGGMISGGVMTGGDMALNAGMRSANYREAGRQITANEYADILRHAAEESGDENLRKLAGKKQTNRSTGKLYEATQEANLTQAVSDRLGALGTPENDVQELTGLVVKQIKGQELTGKEQRKFDASKQAQRAANEYASLFTRDADRTTNAWARSHMRDAAELERNAIYGGARKTDAGQTKAHQAEKNAEVQVNGETAQVQALRYDQESGSVELSVKAKNGDVQRVSVKDAKLPEGMRLLAESAEKYGETAPQMYANYQNGQDVERYASAYEVAYSYGRAGVKNYAVLENSGAASYLTPEQRKFAYETGLAAARRESDAKSAAAKSSEIQAGSVTLEGGKLGNVTLAAVNTAGLTRKQTASIDVARKVAEATGVNVVFFESRSDESGRYIGMNGAYRDGTIYLDVNAGKNNVGTGETAVLKTMSHELTHFIQQNSGQYEALKEFVANHVLESGDSIERLAQQKLDNDSTGELTMDGAMDEVVADACEMMLRNTEAVQRLANENRSLAEKIRDWIGDFVKKLRDAFKGDRATHDEARAMLDRMVELQKLWDDALVDAAKTRAAKENAADHGDVQHSIREEFSDEIDEWARSGMRENEQFVLGSTGPVLQGLGAIESDIFMNGDKIKKILTDHPEMTLAEIKKIPKILEDPAIVLKSKTRKNSIVVFGTYKAVNQKPFLASMDLRPMERGFAIDDMQKVTSAYTKTETLRKTAEENGRDFLLSSEVLFADKKRTASVLRPMGIYAPMELLRSGYVGSITYRGGKVNIEGVPFSSVFRENGADGAQFSLREPVEQVRDLVAVHGLTEQNLRGALALGGLPMPSIAVVKAAQGHSKYGPISMVFGRESIDPQVDPRNKIYGGDAYTPTAPAVEYPVNYDRMRTVEKRLARLSGKIVGGVFRNDSALQRAGVGEESGMSASELADKLSRDDSVRAAYLADRGETLEPVMQAKEFNRYGNDALAKLVQKIGVQELAHVEADMETGDYQSAREIEDTVRQIIRDSYEEQHRRFLDRKPELKEKRLDHFMDNNVHTSTVENFIRDAWAFYEDQGATADEVDRLATSDKLHEATDTEDVKAWLLPQLKSVFGEPGIYNGKERYTASGDRRSFSQLHWEYTLENIVSAMAETQKERGGQTWGTSAGAMQAVSAEDFSSIDEVKAASGRLGKAEGEQYEAAKNAVENLIDQATRTVMRETRPHADNSFDEREIIGDVMMEAAKGKRTARAIQQAFAKEGYSVSEETARRIQEVYKAAAALPTEYFEAKPQRAVGFDEVQVAIVPDNINSELKEQLENMGVPVQVYRAGDEEQRLQILNSDKSWQFSERDDTRTDRDVLSDAADGDAANVRELEMLREYREKLQKYSSLTRRLEQQRDLAQNAESKEERLKARNRADNLAAQVSRADAQLTRMQNAKPLRELVARELKTRDSLAKENAMLRDRVEYWRGQTRRTAEATTDPKAVREAAKDIIKQTGSSIDADEVTGRLQELYDGIARATSENGLSQEDIWKHAYDLAHDILNDVTAVDDTMYREYEDLRKYFKGQQLVVSAADRGEIPDFGDFRRRNMGRMRLKNGERTNVDQVYAELSELYPEFFDQNRESQPSDQLYRIADVLDAVYSVNEYNPNAQYMREATQSVSNEILEQFFDLPQQRTFADRQAKKDEQQKTHYLNQINELRKANDTRIAELRAQNRKRLQEAVAREREKRDEQIARLKDRNAEDKARREESAAVAKYRPRIEQKAKRLSDWLLKNSDKEHIPEPLKLAVGEFLESIDFTSKRALDGGALTKKDIRRSLRYADRMQKLLDSLRGQNDDGTNDLGLYLDIPDGFLEEMQKHINTASDIVSQNPGENVVNRMSGEQLQQLDQMLTILTRSIQNANKLKANAHFETARQAAQATVLELDRLGQAKGRTKAGEKAAGFFNWENTTPYYAFQRFGEGGKAIFEALSDGWDKMAFNTKAVMDFTEQTYTPKEVKAWAKETHTFKLESGESVRMTTAQMMAFYCLSKREQAAGHLLGGGMRVEDIQNSGRKENVKQPDPFLLTQEDIAAINGALTKRQREVADKLQKYMNDQGGAWGNRVSMERFGYRAFTEENYFPIETMDSNRDAKDPGAKENDMFRLLNMSATKSLVYKANNALVVRDIFDVFSNHMADMAKYDALALPILDAMKWYNYREKQKLENGHVLTTTVQRSIEKAYGMDANKYFTTFIKDLNGVNEGGRGEGFAKKMLSNYKVAAVAANLRVALLQPTAYVRAVGVMSPKYLAKAFTEGKSAYKEAEANSGIALWKHMGFYDTNIGMNIRDQIKNAGTWKDSTVEFLMKGAEWGDRLTWGRLWNACKAEVRDKQKLTGDALLKATAERFREVVYSTQVVDSTMTRSQAMRGKSVYGSISTAFMSEPTLSYNLVLKAYTDYTTELRTTGDKKKAWNNAKGKVAWALATYLVSAAASGLVESAVDACRDDDEYATWLEKYLNALIGANYEEGKFSGVRPFDNNLFSDVDILSKLPILKDFMSMISGYGNDRMDTEWISNLIDAYRIWDETIKLATGKLDKPTDVTYNGNMTLYGKIYKTLKAVSQATGLPISAASREVVTLWNTIAGAVGKGDEWTIHTYDSGPESQIKYGLMDGYLTREEAQQLLVEKGLADNEDDAYWKVDKWETGEGKYDEALAAVLSGDKAAFDAQAKELKEHGIGEKQLQSAVRSQAKEWYVGDDNGKRSITKEQALKILQQYGGKDADEAQKLVQKWTCEVVTGTDYDDIKDLYLDGKLTRSRAVDMLTRYGGMKQEDAQNKIDTADFVKAHPECDGISVEAVQKYNEQAKPAGLDAGTFWEAYQFKNDARTTRDSNGKAISGQGAMDKVAAYIDGLNISREQKNALFLCFYSQKSLGKIRWSN